MPVKGGNVAFLLVKLFNRCQLTGEMGLSNWSSCSVDASKLSVNGSLGTMDSGIPKSAAARGLFGLLSEG